MAGSNLFSATTRPDASDGDLSWPTGGGGGGGDGRRSAEDASGVEEGQGRRAEAGQYVQQEEEGGGGQHVTFGAETGSAFGGGVHFVKAGALLHRGDIMPVSAAICYARAMRCPVLTSRVRRYRSGRTTAQY
eukprot:1448547-Rhodomonas_salina.1